MLSHRNFTRMIQVLKYAAFQFSHLSGINQSPIEKASCSVAYKEWLKRLFTTSLSFVSSLSDETTIKPISRSDVLDALRTQLRSQLGVSRPGLWMVCLLTTELIHSARNLFGEGFPQSLFNAWNSNNSLRWSSLTWRINLPNFHQWIKHLGQIRYPADVCALASRYHYS